MKIFFERIDISAIFKNHISTFYDNTNNNSTWGEMAIVFALPLVVLFGTSFFAESFTMQRNTADTLFGGFAIMGGFLINALIVLADRKNNASESAVNQRKLSLIEETFYNVSFGILLCFVTVIACAIYPISVSALFQHIVSFVVYYFSIVFILTIFMVLKRLNAIFNE